MGQIESRVCKPLSFQRLPERYESEQNWRCYGSRPQPVWIALTQQKFAPCSCHDEQAAFFCFLRFRSSCFYLAIFPSEILCLLLYRWPRLLKTPSTLSDWKWQTFPGLTSGFCHTTPTSPQGMLENVGEDMGYLVRINDLFQKRWMSITKVI